MKSEIEFSGMGVTTYTAARILKGQLQGQSGEETVMTMDTFPSVGLAKVQTLITRVALLPYVIAAENGEKPSTVLTFVREVPSETRQQQLFVFRRPTAWTSRSQTAPPPQRRFCAG